MKDPDNRHPSKAPPPKFQHGRLVSTSALPATCTILNGLAGFASLHFATKDALGEAELSNLVIASWLIGIGLVFDALDGRLARFTRRTSDFGAQLDSLSDIITFGVAPAMLMLRTVITVLRGHIERIDMFLGNMAMERVIWCVAAVYVICAALRLARFNVETDPDESAHRSFRGLPSPGAAGAVGAMVLLFANLADFDQGWRSSTWMLATVSITLPVVTLVVAGLMVSSYNYTHIVNHYLGGRKRFGFLVKMAIFILAAVLYFYITAALFAVTYAMSGPIRAAQQHMHKGKDNMDQGVTGES